MSGASASSTRQVRRITLDFVLQKFFRRNASRVVSGWVLFFCSCLFGNPLSWCVRIHIDHFAHVLHAVRLVVLQPRVWGPACSAASTQFLVRGAFCTTITAAGLERDHVKSTSSFMSEVYASPPRIRSVMQKKLSHLNIAFRQCSIICELLAKENQTLQVWGNIFLASMLSTGSDGLSMKDNAFACQRFTKMCTPPRVRNTRWVSFRTL